MLGGRWAGGCVGVGRETRRWASLRMFEPKPRPFRVRQWEAALAPVVPLPDAQDRPAGRCKASVMRRHSRPSPIDAALAQALREELLLAPVLVLAHALPVDERIRHYDLGKLRRAGLRALDRHAAHREPEALLRMAVEGTRLGGLAPLLVSDLTLLEAQELEAPLAKLFRLKLPWLRPLAVVLEQRLVVRASEAEALLRAGPLAQLPAQTAALLRSLPAATSRLLASPAHRTASLLHARQTQLKEAHA